MNVHWKMDTDTVSPIFDLYPIRMHPYPYKVYERMVGTATFLCIWRLLEIKMKNNLDLKYVSLFFYLVYIEAMLLYIESCFFSLHV